MLFFKLYDCYMQVYLLVIFGNAKRIADDNLHKDVEALGEQVMINQIDQTPEVHAMAPPPA